MKKTKISPVKKTIKDPFEGLVLDAYEQEIEDSIPDDFSDFTISKKDRDMFIEAAIQHKAFQKSKRINIRINNEDLSKVKSRAKRNNMPYQTLLSSLVHKFANGELKASL